MRTLLRPTLTLAALVAAAASQALTLDYAGDGSNVPVGGTFTTTSLGYLGDSFNFAKSVTTGATSTIVLSDALGTSGLTLKYTASYVSPDTNLFVGTATATGFGDYLGYAASNLGIVRNKIDTYTISIQGNVAPVPEPASLCALGAGAVTFLRRRKRA